MDEDNASVDASRWGAGLDRLSLWLSYLLVVAGLLCLNRSWTWWRGTPAWSAAVAAVWRKMWG